MGMIMTFRLTVFNRIGIRPVLGSSLAASGEGEDHQDEHPDDAQGVPEPGTDRHPHEYSWSYRSEQACSVTQTSSIIASVKCIACRAVRQVTKALAPVSTASGC